MLMLFAIIKGTRLYDICAVLLLLLSFHFFHDCVYCRLVEGLIWFRIVNMMFEL